MPPTLPAHTIPHRIPLKPGGHYSSCVSGRVKSIRATNVGSHRCQVRISASSMSPAKRIALCFKRNSKSSFRAMAQMKKLMSILTSLATYSQHQPSSKIQARVRHNPENLKQIGQCSYPKSIKSASAFGKPYSWEPCGCQIQLFIKLPIFAGRRFTTQHTSMEVISKKGLNSTDASSGKAWISRTATSFRRRSIPEDTTSLRF